MPGVILQQVSFSYGREAIFSEFSLKLPTSSITSILAPSGAGKTTLLNLIAGFLSPSSGSVAVEEMRPTAAMKRQQVGYFFQSPTLLPWRTVEQNVALGLKFSQKRLIRSEVASRVDEALNLAKIAAARTKYPADLSGGMKARAALARMLAFRPSLWLLDEPFAGLDDLTKEKLLSDLRPAISTYVPTIIFVTHNIVDSISFADRIVVLGKSSHDHVESKLDINIALPTRDRAGMLESADFKLIYQRVRHALGLDEIDAQGIQK